MPKESVVLSMIATSAKSAAINAALSSDMVIGLINRRVSRYGEVRSLRYDAEGFHGVLQLLGSAEIVSVDVRELVFAPDCSSVKLAGLTSNVLWCQHLLEDFVEGRAFDIPENVRAYVKPVAKWL